MTNTHASLKKWLWLLSKVCPDYLYEGIESDLLQKLAWDQKTFGDKKAKRRFIWNVVRFLRPGIILRNSFSFGLNQGTMLKNYFKVMSRNMSRHKFYSAINILGLTVGITFALLIGTFIWSELQVNKSLTDVDRLYILENTTPLDGNPAFFAPAPLGFRTHSQYPDLIEGYYRFWDRGVTISSGDKHFRLQCMIGDSTFLQVFGFQLLHGDATTALSMPDGVVITEKIARQYFNRTDVVGETLVLATEVTGKKNFEIRAVIATPESKNSVTDFMAMDAQVFISLANKTDFGFGTDIDNNWLSEIITYVKLKPGVVAAHANEVFNAVLQKDAPNTINLKRRFALSPLANYYLITNHGAVKTLLISLGGMVVFILLLAISNFINISIAGSFSRLKEIGVRKVIGGLRQQVVVQFLSESMALALASGTIAIVLYELFRKYFSGMLATELRSITSFSFSFWIMICSGVILTGLLAGLYPSIYLSTSKTIESLKGKFKSVSGAIYFSRGLVAAQFLVSIFVFIIAVIMTSQINFFMGKDLGYNRSAVLVVTSAPRLWTAEGFVKMESAKTEFMESSVMEAMSLSVGSPTNLSMGSASLYRPDQQPDQGTGVALTGSDEDFARVYDMKMVAGQFFEDKGSPHQPNEMVLNESAATALAVKVGDKLKMQFAGDTEFRVVGILRDFNYESLHQSVKPMAVLHNRELFSYRYYSFKLRSGDLTTSVEKIETLWKRIFPDDAFVYGFADEKVQAMYKTELQLKKASSIATILMLIIVLMGVLGLVSLSVAKRTKEIGIRKLLGASTSHVLLLLSTEYVIVMTISFVVGIPLSYIFIGKWLSGFAYHISMELWMFGLPVAFLFATTLLVIAAQGVKAALSNPVNALRTE